MSVSPGQVDRVQRLIEKYRDAGMSLIEAVEKAHKEVAQEAAAVAALASKARRVNASDRAMNDTEMDLMCRGDVAGVARLARIREIERQHAGRSK